MIVMMADFSSETRETKRKLWRTLVDKKWKNFFGTPPFERFPTPLWIWVGYVISQEKEYDGSDVVYINDLIPKRMATSSQLWKHLLLKSWGVKYKSNCPAQKSIWRGSMVWEKYIAEPQLPYIYQGDRYLNGPSWLALS